MPDPLHEKIARRHVLQRIRKRAGATNADPSALAAMDAEITALSRAIKIEKSRLSKEAKANRPFRDHAYVTEICKLAKFPPPTFTNTHAIIKVPLFAGISGPIPRKRIQNITSIPPITPDQFKLWCKPLKLHQIAAFLNQEMGNSYHPADIHNFQSGKRPIPPTLRALVHRTKHPYDPRLPA